MQKVRSSGATIYGRRQSITVSVRFARSLAASTALLLSTVNLSHSEDVISRTGSWFTSSFTNPADVTYCMLTTADSKSLRSFWLEWDSRGREFSANVEDFGRALTTSYHSQGTITFGEEKNYAVSYRFFDTHTAKGAIPIGTGRSGLVKGVFGEDFGKARALTIALDDLHWTVDMKGSSAEYSSFKGCVESVTTEVGD